MTVSLRDTRSRGALRRAPSGTCPAASTRPVRAMRAIGRDPLFIERGEGAELIDVDGNRYVDWVCSWGPLILGHADPRGRRGGRPRPRRAARRFGAPTAGEVELAEEVGAPRSRRSRWCG